MIHGIPNVSVPTIHYSMTHGSKMSLPVDSGSLIYSHFEHVSGIAAPEGTQGVSISKLHLLDVLIGYKNQGGKVTDFSNRMIPEAQLDALIENYRNQIMQTRAESIAMPYIPSPNVQSGALFNIVI